MATSHRHADIAEALLEAHVRFTVDELTGRELSRLVEGLLDSALEQARSVALGDAVKPETIKAVARAHAIEIDLVGGIPELVGKVAKELHSHPILERTTLGDVLSDRRVEKVVDHALELSKLRARVVRAVVESPVSESFASEFLFQGIRDYLEHSSRRLPLGPPALSLARAVAHRAGPRVSGAVEETLKQYIATSVRAIARRVAAPLLDGAHDDRLRELLVDAFRQVKGVRVSELRDDVAPEDVEDLIVSGSELWQELRRTELIGAMIDGAIDVVFEEHGETSLAELLDDLGITREIMLAEGMRFAPDAIAALHRAGALESLVRVVLEPFYRSSAIERVLATKLAPA